MAIEVTADQTSDKLAPNPLQCLENARSLEVFNNRSQTIENEEQRQKHSVMNISVSTVTRVLQLCTPNPLAVVFEHASSCLFDLAFHLSSKFFRHSCGLLLIEPASPSLYLR